MDSNLSDFLSDILSQLKNNTISPSTLLSLSEFYLSYTNSTNSNSSITDKTDMKYYTLGWHIYNMIEKDKLT